MSDSPRALLCAGGQRRAWCALVRGVCGADARADRGGVARAGAGPPSLAVTSSRGLCGSARRGLGALAGDRLHVYAERYIRLSCNRPAGGLPLRGTRAQCSCCLWSIFLDPHPAPPTSPPSLSNRVQVYKGKLKTGELVAVKVGGVSDRESRWDEVGLGRLPASPPGASNPKPKSLTPRTHVVCRDTQLSWTCTGNRWSLETCLLRTAGPAAVRAGDGHHRPVHHSQDRRLHAAIPRGTHVEMLGCLVGFPAFKSGVGRRHTPRSASPCGASQRCATPMRRQRMPTCKGVAGSCCNGPSTAIQCNVSSGPAACPLHPLKRMQPANFQPPPPTAADQDRRRGPAGRVGGPLLRGAGLCARGAQRGALCQADGQGPAAGAVVRVRYACGTHAARARGAQRGALRVAVCSD